MGGVAKVAGPLTATGGRWWEAFGSLEGFETLNGVVSHRCCRRVLYRLASGGGGRWSRLPPVGAPQMLPSEGACSRESQMAWGGEVFLIGWFASSHSRPPYR